MVGKGALYCATYAIAGRVGYLNKDWAIFCLLAFAGLFFVWDFVTKMDESRFGFSGLSMIWKWCLLGAFTMALHTLFNQLVVALAALR